MPLKAPFRFAPAGRWVYQPHWGPLTSHDVPFKDGLCGEVDIEIEATTPLLIGGPRLEPNKGLNGSPKRSGEVYPARIGHDGEYMIPSSTLQGMVRSIIEIAGFGRMGPFVDNKRFGIRDLTKEAEPFFANRLNAVNGFAPINVIPRIRAGWLRCIEGKYFLTPCDLARIEFSDVEQFCIPEKITQLRQRSGARDRYRILKTVDVHVVVSPPEGHFHSNRRLKIKYQKAKPASGGMGVVGKLVMTGLTRNAPQPHQTGHKHMEFVFFNERTEEEFELSSAKFDEFRDIHEPDDGRNANESWTYYNNEGYRGEKKFADGGRMPVFYLPQVDQSGHLLNRTVESFGLAFMFKLAHAGSTHDLIGNSTPSHTARRGETGGEIDLPSLIFGEVADQGDPDGGIRPSGLKRRAALDPARPAAGARLRRRTFRNNAVLLGPKPSYYPIYVRQNSEFKTGPANDRRSVAATYTPLTGALLREDGNVQIEVSHAAPELSGTKIWPASGRSLDDLPPIDRSIADKVEIQTKLHALDAGARFATTLRFHNLRPIELGALLWALTFGNEKALEGGESPLRHRIGMGKPYGLGEIRISIGDLRLRPNDPHATTGDLTGMSLVSAFISHMEKVYAAALEERRQVSGQIGKVHSWKDSAQIKALLAAADPRANRVEELKYMLLGDNKTPGTYVTEKRSLTGLPGYGAGVDSELPRGTASTAAGPRPAERAPSVGDQVHSKLHKRDGEILQLPKDGMRPPLWLVAVEGAPKPAWLRREHFELRDRKPSSA